MLFLILFLLEKKIYNLLLLRLLQYFYLRLLHRPRLNNLLIKQLLLQLNFLKQ
jgi:hypothetical protein